MYEIERAMKAAQQKGAGSGDGSMPLDQAGNPAGIPGGAAGAPGMGMSEQAGMGGVPGMGGMGGMAGVGAPPGVGVGAPGAGAPGRPGGLGGLGGDPVVGGQGGLAAIGVGGQGGAEGGAPGMPSVRPMQAATVPKGGALGTPNPAGATMTQGLEVPGQPKGPTSQQVGFGCNTVVYCTIRPTPA